MCLNYPFIYLFFYVYFIKLKQKTVVSVHIIHYKLVPTLKLVSTYIMIKNSCLQYHKISEIKYHVATMIKIFLDYQGLLSKNSSSE